MWDNVVVWVGYIRGFSGVFMINLHPYPQKSTPMPILMDKGFPMHSLAKLPNYDLELLTLLEPGPDDGPDCT